MIRSSPDVLSSTKNTRFSYLLMTMGFRLRLPWIITLLMPFNATILAFMMGSEMESNSAEHAHKHAHIKTMNTMKDSVVLVFQVLPIFVITESGVDLCLIRACICFCCCCSCRSWSRRSCRRSGCSSKRRGLCLF